MRSTKAGLPTTEFARQVGIQPHSVRVRLSEKGSYFGLRPDRLPNGRLLWPSDSLDRLKEAGRETRVREIRPRSSK